MTRTKRKTYRIRGTEWTQEPLLYGSFLSALDILWEHFTDVASSKISIGEFGAQLVRKKVAEQLIPLLLRPHRSSNPIARWRNEHRMKKLGITAENITEHMTFEQITMVALDFFFLNVAWMGSLIGGLIESVSSVATAGNKITDLLSPQASPSTTSQEGT